jgi:hypothetical protein
MSQRSVGRGMVQRGLVGFALCVAAVASIAARPAAPGLTYRIRMVSTPPEIPGMPPQPQMVIVGHGSSAGGLTRLDLDSIPAGAPFVPGDYMLTLDSGRMVVVSPSTKTYSEGIPGMSAMPPEIMAQASFTNVSANLESLGAGEPMQGYPTQKFRLTTQYGLAIMGQFLNTNTTQEIWLAQLPASVVTPFDGAIPASMANGPMKELFEKSTAARKGLGNGTALKTVVTSSITGPMNVTTGSTVELLDIRLGDVDAAAFRIPDGFTKKP